MPPPVPPWTQVSRKRDSFTDDDHKPLDAAVMKTFRHSRALNLEPDLDSLLSMITAGDKRLVTLTQDEAEELLARQPPIKEMLQKAWNEASFKEVRQLEILWPVVREASKRNPIPPNENVELTTEALQSAWRGSYIGNHHRLLFANINAIPRDKPYSNQITIIQGSGTGKSRMSKEQANLVFTIPFNLREIGDNKGSFCFSNSLSSSDFRMDLAFPMPDDAVRDYLVRTSLSDDQHTLEVNYLKFLASLFVQVNDELEKCRGELSKKKIKTSEELAEWWSCHLEDKRTALYKAAIDAAYKGLQILPHEAKPEGFEDRSVAGTAKSALKQLISTLDRLGRSHKIELIKLVIYFDEAHSLTKVIPMKDDEKTLYDHLCSCLNEFLDFPMFTIFLSTNSSLAKFAPPQALAKSARIRGGEAKIHAPITETPFDCSDDLMVRPGELCIKDISTIPFMAKFGRPLFWTLLRGAGNKVSGLQRQILGLARAKLVASRDIDSYYDNFSPPARMAVLDIQLSLDFEPRREKVKYEEARLVESHMRFAYSVPDHREYLRSGYLSEPLLAEAAAQQLRVWRKQKPSIVVETLTNMLQNGLLDRGELGELTGRQLLLDAYHRAVELDQGEKASPNFSAGCRLITFIKTLFSDRYAGMVLDSTPDNVKGTSFREAFKDALICFTHFEKMADNTGVTSTAAWVAFIRHMTIMCRNGERSVDCILPVLLWDTNICEHVMTGVLVQFKRRKQSGTVAKYSIDQADLNFFPKKLEECTHGSKAPAYRPYVCLIMELGVQVKLPEEAQTATKFKPNQGSSSASKQSIRQPRTPPPIEGDIDHATPSKIYIPRHGERHHPPEGHARYHIFAYGCSPTVYAGIDSAQKASYALLLSSRDFLGEHPRKDVDTLKAVRRMKPFWSGGEDCYHWVEHDSILHGPAPLQREYFHVGNQM